MFDIEVFVWPTAWGHEDTRGAREFPLKYNISNYIARNQFQAYYFWQNMMQLAWSNPQITLVNNSASST